MDIRDAGPRRAARPVVLSTALGLGSSALAFCGALYLGQGLAGSALAALLIPLALSGALALGLAVAFVVAVAVEQPAGLRRVSRLAMVVAPLAALAAFFSYAADPAGHGGVPVAGDDVLPDRVAPFVPGRTVDIPRVPRPTSPPDGQPPAGQPERPVPPPAAPPLVVAGPVAPPPAARPPVPPAPPAARPPAPEGPAAPVAEPRTPPLYRPPGGVPAGTPTAPADGCTDKPRKSHPKGKKKKAKACVTRGRASRR